MIRPPFGTVLLLTALAGIAALQPSDEGDPIAQHWIAAPPHGDYIESLDMHGDGTVDAVWGYGQLVRCDYHGRWRRAAGDYLRFEYLLENGDVDVRLLDFAVRKGQFKVIDHDTGKTRRFGCRIAFEETPFPSHCETQQVYYGCEQR